jgi:hypothetical protein
VSAPPRAGDGRVALPSLLLDRHLDAVDPYAKATALIVQVAVVVVGFHLKLGYGILASLPLALVLLPLWLRAVWQYTFAQLLTVLMVGAAVSGLVLSAIAAQDHEINPASRVQMTGLLLSGAAALVLILWARREIPLHRVVALYGFGGVVGAVVDGRISWKYGVALPATFLVLGLLERSGSRVRVALAVTALGIVGVLDDYRSYFAFCLLAATLTMWQTRPPGADRPLSRWWPVIILAAIGMAVYLLMTALMTSGYLGEEVQTRTVEQIEQSGWLLAGGRPEWAATTELMSLRPSGYGAGVLPNLEDIHTASAGLESINIGLNLERDRYMFGTEFRLHSIVADLWVRFGFVGVALAATILVAVVRSLSFSLARRTAATSVILAAVLVLWSLAFEPSYTYWVPVCVGIGLVLVPEDRDGQGRQVRRVP